MEFYRGDFDTALKEYLRSEKLARRSSSIHSDLGLLYRKTARDADASAEFHRALALNLKGSVALEALQQDRETRKQISPAKAGGFRVAGPSRGPEETPHPAAHGRHPFPSEKAVAFLMRLRASRSFPSPAGRGGTARRRVRVFFVTLDASRNCVPELPLQDFAAGWATPLSISTNRKRVPRPCFKAR
jgi:tetratricopeptide (TPR) repeat protein